MTTEEQGELAVDPLRESLRQKFRQRAKGRRISTSALVDEMLQANEITAAELARYARRGLVKEAQDALGEVNPTTRVPDFEPIAGSPHAPLYQQTDLFTAEEYQARLDELAVAIDNDHERYRARVEYFQRRFHRKPRVPTWFKFRRERRAP